MRNLAGMSHRTLGARAKNTPAQRKSHVFTMIAARRPLLLEILPARIAPNAPPIAKTDTAAAHSVVLCPGNTTLSGTFLIRRGGDMRRLGREGGVSIKGGVDM